MIHQRVLPPAQLVSWDGPLSTLTWYRDGGLDETLSEEVKSLLRDAAVAFRPETNAAAKRSSRLD